MFQQVHRCSRSELERIGKLAFGISDDVLCRLAHNRNLRSRESQSSQDISLGSETSQVVLAQFSIISEHDYRNFQEFDYFEYRIPVFSRRSRKQSL